MPHERSKRMNLRWNGAQSRFEAEFQDFHGDLAAVKAAGFRTDGAPEWIWYTYKAGPLSKLKNQRPASGLTISPEAREQYTCLSQMEEKNAALKKEVAAHTKLLKKSLLKIGKSMPEKGYIEASDLPPAPPYAHKYVPPPPPEIKCVVCSDPVYFYERQDPPICFWCEIITLDNSTDVC